LTGINGNSMIRRSIEASGGDLSVLQVSAEVLGRYVRVVNEETEDIEKVRVLASETVLKEVMDDFLVSSAASDLIKDGVLEILSTEDEKRRSVAVTGSEIMCFIDLGESIGAVSTDDEEMVSGATETFESMWEAGDEFTIRTPPESEVMRTLSEDIDEKTRDDFAGMLDALKKAKGGGNGLDEITVALLAAARNKILLYDISKWGEDSGVASKATFSRKKTEMEDVDLIDTENVPIDIGRPRLRLKFADEDLQDAPLEVIVEAAKEAMR